MLSSGALMTVILTAPSSLLLLLATFVFGCSYLRTNSADTTKQPAEIEHQSAFSDDRAAQSIEEAASFVEGKLGSCGSKRTNLQQPERNSTAGWAETSWTLAKSSGCIWQFEYSDNIFGYDPRDPSSHWYDESACLATVNLMQLDLDSITTKPTLHEPNTAYEIYFTTFNRAPQIYLKCGSKRDIHLRSGRKTVSDAGSESTDHEAADLEQWTDGGPFCTDQLTAGMIQKTLVHAAALCGARSGWSGSLSAKQDEPADAELPSQFYN